jgi:hypothetical protein
MDIRFMWRREILALARAANIVANGLEARREKRNLLVPHPAIEEAAVQKNNWLSLASDFVIETCARNFHKAASD